MGNEIKRLYALTDDQKIHAVKALTYDQWAIERRAAANSGSGMNWYELSRMEYVGDETMVK